MYRYARVSGKKLSCCGTFDLQGGDIVSRKLSIREQEICTSLVYIDESLKYIEDVRNHLVRLRDMQLFELRRESNNAALDELALSSSAEVRDFATLGSGISRSKLRKG